MSRRVQKADGPFAPADRIETTDIVTKTFERPFWDRIAGRAAALKTRQRQSEAAFIRIEKNLFTHRRVHDGPAASFVQAAALVRVMMRQEDVIEMLYSDPVQMIDPLSAAKVETDRPVPLFQNVDIAEVFDPPKIFYDLYELGRLFSLEGGAGEPDARAAEQTACERGLEKCSSLHDALFVNTAAI
jgi:hypothetical protein